MLPQIQRARRHLDGVYHATRATIVSEYFLHPVRFFSIFFAIVAALGVFAYFGPIRAQLAAKPQTASVADDGKYKLVNASKLRPDVDPSYDYFEGDVKVVPLSQPINLDVPIDGGQSPKIEVKGATPWLDRQSALNVSVKPKGQVREAKVTPKDNTLHKAGLYTITARDPATNSVIKQQQVAWGVIAFNPDYAIYEPGKTANLAMAVLDDRGKMLCDATLTLNITNPSGQKTTLSTKNGGILVSDACSVYGPTDMPDFYASYKTGDEGTYNVELVSEYSGGRRTLDDSFQVKANQDFYLQRVGATRTYPPVTYTYKLNFESHTDGQYKVKEFAPADFKISDTEATVEKLGDRQSLTWTFQAHTGQTTTLTYHFDTPNISPYLFTLGAAEVTKVGNDRTWTEPRQWLIASDLSCASTGGGGNWSDSTKWTSCGGVVPTNADTVTITNGNNITENTATVPASAGINALTINASAVLTVSSTNTINIDGTTGPVFTNSGTFTANQSTIVFNCAAAITLLSGTFTSASSNNFYNFQLGGLATISTGRTWTAGAAFDVANNLDFVIQGSGGTDAFVFNLSGTTRVTGTTTINHGANATATLGTNSQNLSTGKLVLSAASNTLNIGNTTFTVTGTSGTLLTNSSGTFTIGGTSTTVFNGDGSPTALTDNTNWSFDALQMTPSITADQSYTMGTGTITTNGNFTINPTASSTTKTLTVTLGGAISQAVSTSFTLTLQGTGTGVGKLDTKSGSNYAITYGKLNIAAGGNLTAQGSTVTLTSVASTVFTLDASGDFVAGTSTVVMSGNGTATITSGTFTSSDAFYNLNLSPQLSATAKTYTFGSGAIEVSNGFNLTPTSITASIGLTVNMGANITVSATGTTTINAGDTNSPTVTLDTRPSSTDYNLSTGFLVLGDATGGADTLDAGSSASTITLTGTSGNLLTYAGTFTYGTSTVKVTSGSGSPTLLSGATTMYNLTIDAASATVINMGSAVTLATNGSLTVTAGVFNVDANNFTGPGASGTLTIGSTGTLCLGGTTNSTTATCDSGTTQTTTRNMPSFNSYSFDPASNVIFLSDVDQTVSNTPTYGNLQLNPTFNSITTRTYTFGGGITIAGDLKVMPIALVSGTTNMVVSSSGTTNTTTVSGSTWIQPQSVGSFRIKNTYFKLHPSTTDYNLTTNNLYLYPPAGAYAVYLDGSNSSSTIAVSGNVDMSFGNFTKGNTTFKLNGTSTQTVASAAGTNSYNILTIENSSGSITSTCPATSAFTPGVSFTNDATIDTFNIATSGLSAGVYVRYNSGSTYTVSNISWVGTAAKKIYFRNSNLTSGSWKLAYTPGTQTVSYVDVSSSDATYGTQIIANDGFSVDCGGSATANYNWVFNVNFQGVVYMADETTLATSGNGGPCDGSSAVIAIRVNAGTPTTGSCDGTTAVYNINPGTISPGDRLAIYLTSPSTAKANAVVVAYSKDAGGINLFQNAVALYYTYGSSIAITNMTDYDRTTDTTDMLYDAVSGTPNTLTLIAGTELHLPTAGSFVPVGQVTTPRLHLKGIYTFASGETLTLNGSGTGTSRPFYFDGGTFTTGINSTTAYTGTGATDIEIGVIYRHLQLYPSSGTETYTIPTGTLSISSDMTVNNGGNLTVDANTNDASVEVRGNLTLNDGLTWNPAATGTFKFRTVQGPKTWTDNGSTKQNLGNVLLANGLVTPTLNLGSSVKATTINVGTGHTFVPGANTLTLTGTSGTLFTRVGTFTQGTSEVIVTSASGTPTFLSGTTTFHKLTINAPSATAINMGSAVTLDNAAGSDLTVTAGVFNVDANNFTGPGGTNGTLTIGSSGTLCLGGTTNSTTATCDSGATQTATRDMPTFQTYDFNAASTVRYLSDVDQTVASTAGVPAYGSLILAPKMTASRAYTLGGAMTINGDFSLIPKASAGSTALTVNPGGNITLASGKNTTIQPDSTNSPTAKLCLAGTTCSTGSSYNLTTNALDIESNGTLDATGTTSAINVAGNYTNNGTFTKGSSVVTLNGSGQQTLSGGMLTTNAFYDLTITNSSGTNASDNELTGWVAGIIFDASATSTNNYTITTGSVRVQYKSGSTYTFNNINWNGSACNTAIYFRNSVAGSGSWSVSVSGAQTAVTYLNVNRSNNTGSTITASNTVDASNNTGWSITSGSCGNSAPNAPSSLAQKKTDDTVLATGDWTNETSVKFTATASDPDASDTLYLCVEKDPVATALSSTDGGDSCGSGVAYSGTPVTVTVTIGSLSNGTEYHWQAQVKDAAATYSTWTGYGGNTENPPTNPAARDFGVDTSACTYGSLVYDGTVEDVDATYNDGSLTSLSSNWDAFSCSASGLNKYQYSIGTTVGGTDIKTWTDNATTESVTAASLNLHTSQHYYFNVRAVDNATNTSSVYSSDGQDVLPTISFVISSNTVTFAQLSGTNDFSDSKSVTLTSSTNAYGGYVIRQYAGALLTAPGPKTIPWFQGGSYATPATWGSLPCTSGVNCGYGYTSDDPTIQGSNLFGSGTKYAAFAATPFGDIVADHTDAVNGTSGPVSSEAFIITHKVAVDQLQEALQYTATVYYILTGTF